MDLSSEGDEMTNKRACHKVLVGGRKRAVGGDGAAVVAAEMSSLAVIKTLQVFCAGVWNGAVVLRVGRNMLSR